MSHSSKTSSKELKKLEQQLADDQRTLIEKELRRTIAEKEQIIAEKNRELTAFKLSILKQSDLIVAKEQQCSTLKTDIVKQNMLIATLRKDVVSTAKGDNYELKINAIKQELIELKRRDEMLRKEGDSLRNEIKALQLQKATQTAELTDAKERMNALADEAKKIKKECDVLKEKCSRKSEIFLQKRHLRRSVEHMIPLMKSEELVGEKVLENVCQRVEKDLDLDVKLMQYPMKHFMKPIVEEMLDRIRIQHSSKSSPLSNSRGTREDIIPAKQKKPRVGDVKLKLEWQEDTNSVDSELTVDEVFSPKHK